LIERIQAYSDYEEPQIRRALLDAYGDITPFLNPEPGEDAERHARRVIAALEEANLFERPEAREERPEAREEETTVAIVSEAEVRAQEIVDLAEEMFRQMRQMSNYSEIRDQVQGNRAENRPPDYTAIGRQKSVIKISLEILGSRDEEQLEADVREVLNRMIDLVSADEGTVDLFIDKGESYARYDAPIKEEQEQVEAR